MTSSPQYLDLELPTCFLGLIIHRTSTRGFFATVLTSEVSIIFAPAGSKLSIDCADARLASASRMLLLRRPIQHPPRPLRSQLPSDNNRLPVNHNILEPDRILMRLRELCFIRDCGRVEHYYIRFHPWTQQTSVV